jgi:diadenylate cyclase
MAGLQNLFQRLGSMQWSDYLDILLVAYIIYSLIPLIRNSNTMRIARAVMVVLGIAWLTGEMNLYTVNYILNQILAVGVLAVVVLFQPELRRMLDRLGNVRIRSLLGLNSKTNSDLDPIISQTVAACEVMSRERVGALIVFAREARLEEYFKTGTLIDGQVSEQLIRNVFFVKAPLHDGAMIIRDGRIAAAGCVLPLSDSSRLSADLGTRHRAGVGMSEVSDAVVVIVSEETGTISVAVGGMLKRHLAPQTLGRLLHNELRSGEAQEEKTTLLTRLQDLLAKSEEEGNHEK